MADRETQVTFEDEDGLVTETDSRDTRDGAKERDAANEGDSSETTSADPGYDWAFPATTIEGTVAPAETAAPADNSELPKDPSVAEVFAAAHQAALRGEEIQDGSPLDIAMKAAMEEIATGSNLSENPTPNEVFSQMRSAELLGLEVPADSPLQQAMDKVMDHIQTGDYLGDNPAPEEVFGAMRQAELLGLEVPPDSPLQKAMDKVMDHIQTGDYLGDNPAPEAVLGAMRQAELMGLEVAPDSPLQQAMDKVMDQIQTGSTLGPNPSAADVLGAARQAELLGLTPPPESPLAMAMANLTGSTGGIVTPSSTGFPSNGGMTSSGGTTTSTTQTTSGSSNNDTTEAPVDRSDPIGTETHLGGSGSTGSTGTGSTTPTSGTGAGYSYTSPMGTTGVLNADGTTTITDAAGNVVPPGGGSQQPPEEKEDPPPEDKEDPPPEDKEDPPPEEEEEEDDEEGMTDPDATTSTTGLVAGIVVEPVGIDDVLFGSSTAPGGGATDGPRGDLDTGNGTITGEIVGPRPGAGPDVDPDNQTGAGGRLADPFHSGTGVGTVDGVRPDLLDAIGGGGAPEMDPSTGVNPNAAGDGDDALAAATPAHLAAGHDAASFGGAEDNAFGEIADADLHIDSAFSAIEEDGPGSTSGAVFGGPLDDGFDAP